MADNDYGALGRNRAARSGQRKVMQLDDGTPIYFPANTSRSEMNQVGGEVNGMRQMSNLGRFFSSTVGALNQAREASRSENTMPDPGNPVSYLGMDPEQTIQLMGMMQRGNQDSLEAKLERERMQNVEMENAKARQQELKLAQINAQNEAMLIGERANAEVGVQHATGQVAERDARTGNIEASTDQIKQSVEQAKLAFPVDMAMKRASIADIKAGTRLKAAQKGLVALQRAAASYDLETRPDPAYARDINNLKMYFSIMTEWETFKKLEYEVDTAKSKSEMDRLLLQEAMNGDAAVTKEDLELADSYWNMAMKASGLPADIQEKIDSGEIDLMADVEAMKEAGISDNEILKLKRARDRAAVMMAEGGVDPRLFRGLGMTPEIIPYIDPDKGEPVYRDGKMLVQQAYDFSDMKETNAPLMLVDPFTGDPTPDILIYSPPYAAGAEEVLEAHNTGDGSGFTAAILKKISETSLQDDPEEPPVSSGSPEKSGGDETGGSTYGHGHPKSKDNS